MATTKDVTQAIIDFAAAIKDDPFSSDNVRAAATDLHETLNPSKDTPTTAS